MNLGQFPVDENVNRLFDIYISPHAFVNRDSDTAFHHPMRKKELIQACGGKDIA
jgi:hypothetical protein